MFNNKDLKGKRITYKKLNYATFANGLNTDIDSYILPINRSVNTYNFNFSNGALKTGLGVDTLQLPIRKNDDEMRDVVLPEGLTVKAVWKFRFIHPVSKDRSDMLVFMTTENTFKFMPIYNYRVFTLNIDNLTLNNIPNVINYNISGYDSLIFTSPEGMFVWCPESMVYPELTKVESAPEIASMTIHYERIFATISGAKEEVWFSKELDPTNWNPTLNDGGFIVLKDEKGQSNKVISFNDYVYVFRDYGINRITAYANQTEFNVSQLFVSSGQIFSKTVCACGDRIIMLTENGLYAFDGTNTIKLNVYVNKLLETANNVNAQAVYFNGKYYLACRLRFNDGKRIGNEDYDIIANNCLIELDIKTNAINILRGVNIKSLCPIVDDQISKLAAVIYHKRQYLFGEIKNCGTVFGEPTEKCWESPLSDFGYPEKEKVIRDVYIKSSHPLKVKIRTERHEYNFSRKPIKGLIHIRTSVKGNLLAVDFHSEVKDANISSPTLVVGVS